MTVTAGFDTKFESPELQLLETELFSLTNVSSDQRKLVFDLTPKVPVANKVRFAVGELVTRLEIRQNSELLVRLRLPVRMKVPPIIRPSVFSLREAETDVNFFIVGEIPLLGESKSEARFELVFLGHDSLPVEIVWKNDRVGVCSVRVPAAHSGNAELVGILPGGTKCVIGRVLFER